MVEEYRVLFDIYEISNLGNYRRRLPNGGYRQIKGCIGSHGYRYFRLYRNGKRKNYLFHQMVMKAFIGDYPPDKPHIDHIDRNPLNNRLENLRYVTAQENLRNTAVFRNDIKEEGRDRVNAINRDNCRRRREAKTYYCALCEIACVAPSNLNIHNNGYRHKLKERYKVQMDLAGVPWTLENYKKCRERYNDYCGKVKKNPNRKKPLVCI